MRKRETTQQTRKIVAKPVIQSMTGFGRGMKNTRDISVTVDIRSTNHRYLEVEYRMPGGMHGLQGELTQLIRGTLKRGRIEVSCNVQSTASTQKQVRLNDALADRYFEVLQEMKSRYALPGPITLDHLLSFQALIATTDEKVPAAELEAPIKAATQAALQALIRAKRREGRRLVLDIRQQIQTITLNERIIRKRLPKALKEQREQLKERVHTLLKPKNGVSVSHIEELVSLLKDADVNEELVRIESHLDHLRQTLKAKGLVGKQIDFIAQELTRETNTLGAKVSDSEAARHVVAIKGCIEKIREQTQNLE